MSGKSAHSRLLSSMISSKKSFSSSMPPFYTTNGCSFMGPTGGGSTAPPISETPFRQLDPGRRSPLGLLWKSFERQEDTRTLLCKKNPEREVPRVGSNLIYVPAEMASSPQPLDSHLTHGGDNLRPLLSVQFHQRVSHRSAATRSLVVPPSTRGPAFHLAYRSASASNGNALTNAANRFASVGVRSSGKVRTSPGRPGRRANRWSR